MYQKHIYVSHQTLYLTRCMATGCVAFITCCLCYFLLYVISYIICLHNSLFSLPYVSLLFSLCCPYEKSSIVMIRVLFTISVTPIIKIVSLITFSYLIWVTGSRFLKLPQNRFSFSFFFSFFQYGFVFFDLWQFSIFFISFSPARSSRSSFSLLISTNRDISFFH